MAETTPTDAKPGSEIESGSTGNEHVSSESQASGKTQAPRTNPECTREISVDIPQELVTKEIESLTDEYRRKARVPGFRPGKVPSGLIRRRFGDEIRQEVVEKLVPRYFRQEALNRGFVPVSQPYLTELSVAEGQPWHFRANFEIMPDLDIHDYDRVSIEKPRVAVSDEELEKDLSAYRESFAEFQEVGEDRELHAGDWARISFEGWLTPEGEAGAEPAATKPVHAQKERLFEIDAQDDPLSPISQPLRGAGKGAIRRFEVEYPEDFVGKRLAGKKVTYTATLDGILVRSIPELNDEFAEKYSGKKTVEEFRNSFREYLQEKRQREADREARNMLVDQLVDRYEFPIPESLVQRQLDQRLERGLRALAYQGMQEEEMRRLDFQQIRESQRDAAVREVKASLIIDRIAENEKIEIGAEDVDREVLRLAESTRENPDTLRRRLADNGGLDTLTDRLRSEKTVEYLYNRVITPEAPR